MSRWCGCERIVDTTGVCRAGREVAGAFQCGRNEPFQVDWILLANLFEIHKEKCLVLDDWPPDREAILIADVVGLFARVEEIASIKVGSLPVPPAAAVKRIRALLQHHIYDRAAIVAKLGGKA